MLKIVADENMPALDETFAPGNELVRLNGRQIRPEDLDDADVLLVRSITRVDANLLKNSKVRFVGSATIGFDHLDTPWLTSKGIQWANAPGCNADAAAQYTLAVMMLACERLGKDFRQQTVGVIGRGNVGSRLVKLLQSLDISVVACDPPLQGAGQTELVSMGEACSQNIVSIHVPLTHDGPYPTDHMFNRARLSKLPPDTLLVNAARGGVVDAAALTGALETRRLNVALDVWPHEPHIEHKLINQAIVATPHVAGSSVQGKRNGTLMIYRSFCQAFPEQKPMSNLSNPQNTVAGILDFSPDESFDRALQQLIQTSCPVARDDQALRSLLIHNPNDTHVQIDSLRSHYPRRYEFASWAFRGVNNTVASALNRLGFLNA